MGHLFTHLHIYPPPMPHLYHMGLYVGAFVKLQVMLQGLRGDPLLFLESWDTFPQQLKWVLAHQDLGPVTHTLWIHTPQVPSHVTPTRSQKGTVPWSLTNLK